MSVSRSRVNRNSIPAEEPLYLQLDQETRDEVKSILGEFNSVLGGQKLKLKEKKELLERNRQLMLKFSRIPRFYYGPQTTPKRNTSRPRNRSRRSSPSRTRDPLVLAHSMRQGILDIMYQNQDFAILFSDHFAERSKRDLITVNHRLIASLNDLRYRPSEKPRPRFANFTRLTASLTTTSEGTSEGTFEFILILIEKFL